MANGDFSPKHVAILEAMGKWTSANGEAIYGADPAPECTIDTTGGFKCYATKTATNIYLHVIHWPADGSPGSVQISRTGLIEAGLLDKSLGKITVESTQTSANDSVSLKIPKPANVDPCATVVRLTFKSTAAK
jgi:alpha-L-fucosidase